MSATRPIPITRGTSPMGRNTTITLSRSRPIPDAIPFDLREYIPQDVWRTRLPIIKRTALWYSMPRLERTWLAIGFLSSIILPIVFYQLILSHSQQAAGDSIAIAGVGAQGISFGLFVGACVFFFVPIILFKFIGQQRMNAMLRRWVIADRVQCGRGAVLPVWRVHTPGVFRTHITLTISLPYNTPTSSASSRHQDVQVPALERPKACLVNPGSHYASHDDVCFIHSLPQCDTLDDGLHSIPEADEKDLAEKV
ncbi:hypothetical protein FISHEDRAFT_73762 [Fistulina hepatica ATCC 64428]|uniref:Uncharacterized protein n=1 Tax=Fistulina hepatica ATCC 64428 TaxID=1128425 RepID=A0A0D7AE96_9AGAR|nr:hypothetical protein FISHEDRAFT_73762 [Fistulina hepatica ATCC 64428]